MQKYVPWNSSRVFSIINYIIDLLLDFWEICILIKTFDEKRIRCFYHVRLFSNPQTLHI